MTESERTLIGALAYLRDLATEARINDSPDAAVWYKIVERLRDIADHAITEHWANDPEGTGRIVP